MPLRRGKDEGTNDDTEGHMPLARKVEEADGADDSEGHAIRGKGGLQPSEGADDTGGHVGRFKGIEEATADDVEGHAIKPRGLQPAERMDERDSSRKP